MIEIWDENGMVAYVDESERGSAVFGVPDKGPRECAGKKIPMVKHGKQNIMFNSRYCEIWLTKKQNVRR